MLEMDILVIIKATSFSSYLIPPRPHKKPGHQKFGPRDKSEIMKKFSCLLEIEWIPVFVLVKINCQDSRAFYKVGIFSITLINN